MLPHRDDRPVSKPDLPLTRQTVVHIGGGGSFKRQLVPQTNIAQAKGPNPYLHVGEEPVYQLHK